MKKLFAIAALLALVLCGCAEEIKDNSSEITSTDISSLPISTDVSSSLASSDTQKFEKYVGKHEPADVSLGYWNFAQNEENYYYVDFHQAYSVNKKTKEKTALFDTTIGLSMFHYKDYMIFDGSGDNIFLYNLQTKEKLTKKYPKEWIMEYHLTPSFYMTENGYVMTGYCPDDEKEKTYYIDSEFKTRKLLNTDNCYTVSFVLGDDIFYLGEDGNVYCCNIKDDKKYYVTDYKATPYDYENPDRLSSDILKYLGKGKILVYGDEKLQILNLYDDSSFRPYTAEQEQQIQEVNAIYDDDAIYFIVWESATEYRIDVLDYETLVPKTVYKGRQTEYDEELSFPTHDVDLLSSDSEYLYLEDFASFDKGHHFRIKKDGSDKEVLFHHFGEEIYSIDSHE